MNQNLSSYWIFYTVANAGNISKAAKELYISQPAISKSIQKLEDNLGCKLFSRSSRGVILTDEGQLLYGHVKEAFETLNQGEEKLKRSIDLGVGHLQIGVSSTLCKHILLPYLNSDLPCKRGLSLVSWLFFDGYLPVSYNERLMSSTLYSITPACVSTVTTSPICLPIRA